MVDYTRVPGGQDNIYTANMPSNETLMGKGSPNEKSIFSTAQVPPLPAIQRGRFARVLDFANRFWLTELVACVVSWIALICMAVLLSFLNGKSASGYLGKWATPVLGFLGTIVRTSLMMPVAGALGQLKWDMFRGKKSSALDTMESFNDATRGPSGALKLAWRLKFKRFAVLGALVSVLSLSNDALVQRSLETVSQTSTIPPSQSQGVPPAVVYRTNNYDSITLFNTGKVLPASTLQTQFFYAISSQTKGDLGLFNQELWQCTTGNCTYPTYQTLTTDYQCIDLSSKLPNPLPTIVKHPSDSTVVLNTNGGIITSQSIFTDPDQTLYSAPLGKLITRWLVLARNFGSGSDNAVVATECSIYWAVSTYQNSSVTLGAFSETRTNPITKYTTITNTKTKTAASYNITADPCYSQDGKTIASSDSSCTYSIDANAHEALQNYFNLAYISFNGNASIISGSLSDAGDATFGYDSAFLLSLLPDLNGSNRGQTVASLANIAGRGAALLNTKIRVAPQFAADGTATHGLVNGKAMLMLAVYKAVPYALVGPGVLVLLSTIFFLATAFFSRNQQKWKNSQMALFFHGLTPEDIARVSHISSFGDMKDAAKQIDVKIVDTAYGEKLMSKELIARDS
ncbi:hypothetical protein BT63DRAFT_154745 [Microthyrium microscopicum]|uniref:Uncharacterized protein n=1 Tax=Microthyrium microscopicum TaxID=703497 RepID=A0A6A6UPR7_9PEZI|nr:hypothetical protein BT63DRAFT_154745 [Microthyrium microscopicum]